MPRTKTIAGPSLDHYSKSPSRVALGWHNILKKLKAAKSNKYRFKKSGNTIFVLGRKISNDGPVAMTKFQTFDRSRTPKRIICITIL